MAQEYTGSATRMPWAEKYIPKKVDVPINFDRPVTFPYGANITGLTIGGVSLAPSATTDTTNAANISSGTLPHARLPAFIAADIAGLAGDAMTTLGRTLGARAADTIKAADYGVVCDGDASKVVANSNNLQTAINTAEGAHKALELPGGICVANNLLANTALTMRGQGEAATTLYSPSGSTHPTLTVAVTTAYSPGGVTTTTVELDGIRIAGSVGDTANAAVAHGIAFLDSGAHIQTRLKLLGVFIEGVAGDALHGEVNPSSWVEAYGSQIQYPGGYGLYANSVSDWKWIGGAINGATLDNVLLSTASNMHFVSTEIYTAKRYNVYLSGPTSAVRFTDCHIDLAQQHGVYNATTAGAWASFDNTSFRWSSQQTNHGYDDIYSEAASAGKIFLKSARFASAAENTFSANNPAVHIGFNASSTAVVMVDAETVFDAGPLLTTSADTNDLTKIVGQTLSGNAVVSVH